MRLGGVGLRRLTMTMSKDTGQGTQGDGTHSTGHSTKAKEAPTTLLLFHFVQNGVQVCRTPELLREQGTWSRLWVAPFLFVLFVRHCGPPATAYPRLPTCICVLLDCFSWNVIRKFWIQIQMTLYLAIFSELLFVRPTLTCRIPCFPSQLRALLSLAYTKIFRLVSFSF